MSGRVFAGACLLLLLTTGCATPLQREQKTTAVPFAERWLGYLETGDQELAWGDVSKMAKLRYEQDLVLKNWFGSREPLGRLLDRSLHVNWRVNPAFIATAPDGAYWQVVYWTDFENRERVTEDLLLLWEDDQWRLVSFALR